MDAEQIRSIDVMTGQINALPNFTDPGDKGLNVTFKMHSHFNDVKTRSESRPIFEMAEYIMILIPGDTTSSVFRPVRHGDKERFPEQYLRFKAGQEQTQGTPLSEWNGVTRAQVDELSYFRITTVEQLAATSDANCQHFMGLSQMRDHARRYLKQMHDEAPIMHLQAQISAKDEEVNAMKAQLEQLQTLVARLTGGTNPTPTPDLVPTPKAPEVDDALFET